MQYKVIYDGSFEGFFSAVFEIYERKLTAVILCKEKVETASLFAAAIKVHTDLHKAARVMNAIEKLAGKAAISLLYTCYLSEQQRIEDHMLSVTRYLFRANTNVLNDFSDPDVLVLKQTEKMMKRERHRMTAFVRFQSGSDGLYYAMIEPDFDVLPLLVDHFKGRYADQRWLIYDSKRQYGICYNLHDVLFVEPGEGTGAAHTKRILFDEKEEWYQQLWAGYFKHTNIASRKNSKLHLQHVPKRYWKYLPEKTSGLI